MTKQETIELEQCLAMHRRISSGEIPPLEAVEQLVAAGVPREFANRRVAILTGQYQNGKSPDPNKCL